MRVPREQISTALFALFTGNPQLVALLKSITRVTKMWTEVTDNNKPMLILFKGGPATEAYVQPQNQQLGLTKYIITYNLWLYLTASASATATAETLMNNIADQIDISMQGGVSRGSFGERQTLGGIVNNAWIEGGSEWAREFQDQNIVAMWRIQVETGI